MNRIVAEQDFYSGTVAIGFFISPTFHHPSLHS